MRGFPGIVAALTAAAMLAPSVTAAGEPTAVGVLNFANQVRGPAGQEWNWLEKGLADLVINDLSHRRELLLVDREHMQETLMAEGLTITPETDLREVRTAIVKRFKVGRLVFGSFRADGDKATLNASIVDAYSGRLVRRIRVVGGAKDVLKLQKQLSGRIIAALLGRADLKDITASLPIWTESLPASKLLYTAVDNFDRGRFPEAWLYARRAWRADRGYADALYWVGRMHYYMLQYPHARRCFERFVYEHSGHPRNAEAVLEYLDTYERAAPTVSAKVEEIDSLVKHAIPNVRMRAFGPPGFEDWSLHAYLQFRKAAYLQSSTQYALAARVLLPLLEPSEGYTSFGGGKGNVSIADLYRSVRMQTGSVLGQPTTLGRVVLPPPWEPAYTGLGPMGPSVRLLRPGIDNRFFSVKPDGKPSETREGQLLIIPPNHRIQHVRIDAIGTPQTSKMKYGYKWRLCLRLDTHTREPNTRTEQRSPYVLFADPHQTHTLRYEPLTIGRVFCATAVVGYDWPPLPRTAPREVRRFRHEHGRYTAQSMAWSVELAPADRCGHAYLDLGALGFLSNPRTTLNGHRVVRRFRGHDYLCFLRCQPHRVECRPRNMPANSLVLSPRPQEMKHVRLASSTFSRPGRANAPATTTHLIARHYTTMYGSGRDPASVVVGSGGEWVALWQAGGDLWQAESADRGRSWSAPRLLPVPVNSANRDWDPQLVRLNSGLYVLCFRSDRGLPRKVRFYLSTSYDLRRWSWPRETPMPNVWYVGRGLAGELILGGFDAGMLPPEGGRVLEVNKRDRGSRLLLARSFDGRRFDVLAAPTENKNVMLLTAWYDETAGEYHCVKAYRTPWPRDNYGLVEYVGDAAGGLRPFAGFAEGLPVTHSGVEFTSLLEQGRLVVFSPNCRKAWIFKGPSLASPYRLLTLDVTANKRAGGVTAGGKVLFGSGYAAYERTVGDSVFMVSADLGDFLTGPFRPASVTDLGPRSTN